MIHSTYENQMNKEKSNSKALKVLLLVIFNPLKGDATYPYSYLTWLYSKMMCKKEKVDHSKPMTLHLANQVLSCSSWADAIRGLSFFIK